MRAAVDGLLWLGRLDPGGLAGVLILTPVLTGLFVYFVRTKWSRKGVVTATGWILSLGALALFGYGAVRRDTVGFMPPSVPGVSWDAVVLVLDLLLMVGFVGIGAAIRKPVIALLAVLQAGPMLWVELTHADGAGHAPLYVDWLAIIMVMIVSVIGSIVAVYGLPYMKEHEKHLGVPDTASKRPRFFLTILVFLGAMNGLVLSDNLLWLFFFWEVTTLCSFLLIRHDETPEAEANAFRALWINMVGGLLFVAGLVVLSQGLGTVSIQRIVENRATVVVSPLMLIGLGLLCLAGFTKAAQMPFHSWLLGAMVAPTPVSALLHSSTMVKAGVYLIARLAPAFYDTGMSDMVAVAGSFTFAAAAFLAIGQTNAKKVLAYSTISNLGLIIACAGLNSPLSMAAAVMLIIFHAISKALLFMAAGVVEHGIWSRDIEDMQGLVSRMPLTTLTMVIGILSMLLPPFGVLIAKLAALEASVRMPLALLLLVVGSTLTVMFWTKWTGRLLTADPAVVFPRIEHLHSMYFVPLLMLTAGALGFSLMVVPLLTQLIVPAVSQYYRSVQSDLVTTVQFDNVLGVPWPLVFGVLVLAVVWPILYFRGPRSQRTGVYLCGEQVEEAPTTTFRTAAETAVPVTVRGHYFERAVGESLHTGWMTTVSVVALALILGAAFLPR